MTISYGPYAAETLFITWAGLFAVAAIVAGGTLYVVAMARRGIGWRTTLSIGLFAVLGGVVGARLFHIVDYVDFYTGAPFQIFYIWEGGFALWGGVLGGLAAGLWKAEREWAPLSLTADAAVVPGALGLAIGRIGGFIGGDPPATESSLPWAVVYDHPHSFAYADGAAVHPVAAYEMLWDIAVVLWALRLRRSAPPGALMPLALAVWGAGRFAIAFVRLDPVTFGLQQAQWVALGVVVVVAVAWLRHWRRRSALVRAGGEAGSRPRNPG